MFVYITRNSAVGHVSGNLFLSLTLTCSDEGHLLRETGVVVQENVPDAGVKKLNERWTNHWRRLHNKNVHCQCYIQLLRTDWVLYSLSAHLRDPNVSPAWDFAQPAGVKGGSCTIPQNIIFSTTVSSLLKYNILWVPQFLISCEGFSVSVSSVVGKCLRVN